MSAFRKRENLIKVAFPLQFLPALSPTADAFSVPIITRHFISALQNAAFHFQRLEKLQGGDECGAFLPMCSTLQTTCMNSTLAGCKLPSFKGSVFYIVCKNSFFGFNFLQMKAARTALLLHCTPGREDDNPPDIAHLCEFHALGSSKVAPLFARAEILNAFKFGRKLQKEALIFVTRTSSQKT